MNRFFIYNIVFVFMFSYGFSEKRINGERREIMMIK